MAVRNKNKNNSDKGPQATVIFWLIFIIVIISVFMFNAQTIQTNFNLFKNRLTSASGAQEELLMTDEELIVTIIGDQNEKLPEVIAAEPQTRTQTPESSPDTRIESQPGSQTQPQQQTQPQPQTPAPVQTRDRTIYFTHVSSDGQILQSSVTRRLPVSESPMMDALNALLTGPSADELAKGIINLIPRNTRIISATVRGNTAYINFSEDFMFNTFGVEGYVAQLRQIVWTVTEFSNVSDVQVLIESRRVDYLAEGIWIGSPINRQLF